MARLCFLGPYFRPSMDISAFIAYKSLIPNVCPYFFFLHAVFVSRAWSEMVACEAELPFKDTRIIDLKVAILVGVCSSGFDLEKAMRSWSGLRNGITTVLTTHSMRLHFMQHKETLPFNTSCSLKELDIL